jgi:hypothetical protein
MLDSYAPAANARMEILEIGIPIPRRNTSPPCQAAERSGNEAEIRFRFISTSFPLYFHCPVSPAFGVEINRKHISCLFPLAENAIANRDNTMPGKPYQSVLIPYEQEILTMRHRRPPMPYCRIAKILMEKYQIHVQAPAIFKFIKIRSKGRKVFSYGRNVPAVNPSVAKPVAPVQPAARPLVAPKQNSNPKPSSRFEYTYSDHYNLHRLTPDEAEALRKKLSEGNQ